MAYNPFTIYVQLAIQFKREDDKPITNIPQIIKEWFTPLYTTHKYLTCIFNYIDVVDSYTIEFENDCAYVEAKISGEIVYWLDADESYSESFWYWHRDDLCKTSNAFACEADGTTYRYSITSAEFIEATLD
jgi:hypothetical protein